MVMTLLNILPSFERYGEFVWSSYSLSFGALVILAILSWRKKIVLEKRLEKITAKKSKT
ncbi:MAG: heme exporter protein CcmD [Proteobacteria bacterium]|nr:heme exporter protein CcmD [Pseudomonadota bacterium]